MGRKRARWYRMAVLPLAGWMLVQGELAGAEPSVREAFAAAAATAEANDAVAVAGADDWLFLVSELRALGRASFWGDAAEDQARDPFAAIVDLHAKLSDLGIALVLVPAPPRAAVYPDRAIGVREHPARARVDPSLRALYADLRAEGVAVLDLTETFRAARADDAEQGPVCCPQDTHWSPRGIRIAADAIAAAVRDAVDLPPAPDASIHRLASRTLTYVGDLTDRLPGFAGAETTTTIAPVSSLKETLVPVEPDEDSPVLLLADSHGLVFSIGGDMHCEGAGLPEQLAFALQRPVDVMARRGSGGSVRIDLARRFLRKPEEAAAKKVVVYCFAARTFSESTDWKPVPLQR